MRALAAGGSGGTTGSTITVIVIVSTTGSASRCGRTGLASGIGRNGTLRYGTIIGAERTTVEDLSIGTNYRCAVRGLSSGSRTAIGNTTGSANGIALGIKLSITLQNWTGRLGSSSVAGRSLSSGRTGYGRLIRNWSDIG